MKSNWSWKLRKLNVDYNLADWAEGYETLGDIWRNCKRGDWMCDILMLEVVDREEITLMACECAHFALPYVGKEKKCLLNVIKTVASYVEDEGNVTAEDAGKAFMDADRVSGRVSGINDVAERRRSAITANSDQGIAFAIAAAAHAATEAVMRNSKHVTSGAVRSAGRAAYTTTCSVVDAVTDAADKVANAASSAHYAVAAIRGIAEMTVPNADVNSLAIRSIQLIGYAAKQAARSKGTNASEAEQKALALCADVIRNYFQAPGLEKLHR